MKCKYIYQNNDPVSYDQILDIVDGIKEVTSDYILFSAASEQDLAISLLNDVRESSKDIIPTRLEFRQDCDGENLTSTNNYMHLLTFLNNPNLFIDESSKPYVLSLNDDQYKQVIKEQLKIEHPELDDDALDRQVEVRFRNFELQGIDGYILHTMLNLNPEVIADDIKFNAQLDRVASKYKDNTAFINRVEELKNDGNFKQWVRLMQNSLAPTRPKDSKVIFQLPVAGDIDVNGKKIKVYDIVDQVVIQADGTIHLYKVKVSEQPKGSWANIKANTSPRVERYRYELNLIKALLENYGLRGNKIQLHILGVTTEYSTDDTVMKLLSVDSNVENIQMDINRSSVQTSKHYDVARKLVRPKLQPKVDISNVVKANSNIALLFPETGIQLGLIDQSVESWIRYNKSRIHKLEGNTYAYQIFYPGMEPIRIKDKADIENNAEIRERLEEILSNESSKQEFVISSLQSVITQAFRTGKISFNTKAFSNCEEKIKQTLAPYLEDSYLDSDGQRVFNWQYEDIPELLDLGIIMLRHKSGQVDFISLSNTSVDATYSFANGKNTLAGGYVYDIDSNGIESATSGSIQATKVLMLINEIISQLQGIQLGNLTILSTYHTGQSRIYNIQNFTHRNLAPLIQIVRSNNNEARIINNLSNTKGVDYLSQLLVMLKGCINSGAYSDVPHIKENIAHIENATTDSEKFKYLVELSQSFMLETGLTNASLQDWVNNLTIKGQTAPLKYRIGKAIADALSQLKQYEVFEPKRISGIQQALMPIRSINSNNGKAIFMLYNEYSNVINDEAHSEGLTIDKIVKEYYQAKGYTALQNRTLGNQTNTFKNLFETDEKGNYHPSMRLKNAWDDSVALMQFERKFIKQIVFLFTKYRFQNKGLEFKFTSWDSPDFRDYVDKNLSWVLAVPLMKASSSSKVQTGYAVQDTFARIKSFLTDPMLYSKNIIDNKAIAEELRSRKVIEDVWQVSPHNYFQYGEPELKVGDQEADLTLREQALANHTDPRYFETNLEDLIRDFSMETVRSQNMRRFMIASKLFCMKMYFTKNQLTNSKALESELDVINSFIKVNVFGQPLVEANSMVFAHTVSKLRSFVSKLFIAGNVAGAARDTIEGFSQMMVKAITKEDPSLKTANVLRAYGIVAKDMATNITVANLVSQLCIKYRMSNIDVANVSEGMKTGKSGIFHFETEMYKTLRTPDFLNRMVYFVAKAIQDGVWDALSLDVNGHIKYDWKKDKRFKLLADNDQSNKEEYLKQKGLFIAYVKLWNQEHPNEIISDYSTLPMPYSNQEVNQIHAEADRIWGSYDRSTKALGEHAIMGLTFGMFMTWMSGQIEWYFRGTQKSIDTFEWQQMKDDATGQLLWLDKDGNITTQNTGEPCYVRVPIMVQGIIGTLKQMWQVLNTEGETWKDNVFNNSQNVKNMYKLRNDVVVSIIYLAILRAILIAMREKQKKATDPHDLITNAICEVLYRGMYNSWDGFRGPLNIVMFLGEETNPPFYTESLQIAKDLFRTTVGDMTILSFGSRHLAPIRSIRETIKAYETGKQPS